MFSRIALIGKLGSPEIAASLRELIGLLEKRGCEALVEKETAAELGLPVAFDTPAVLSPAFGVADMSRTVAGAAAPVSPSVACLLLSVHAPATAMASEKASAARSRNPGTVLCGWGG